MSYLFPQSNTFTKYSTSVGNHLIAMHWVEIQPGSRGTVEKPTALVGNPTGEIFMRNVNLGKLNLKLP